MSVPPILSVAIGIPALLRALETEAWRELGIGFPVLIAFWAAVTGMLVYAAAACWALRVVIDAEGIHLGTPWSLTRRMHWEEITRAEVWGGPRMFRRTRTLTLSGPATSLMLGLDGLRGGALLLSEIVARAGLQCVRSEKGWAHECEIWERPGLGGRPP